MDRYLADYAIDNTWCNPNQDRHVVIKPARVSKPAGTRDYIQIFTRQFKLPVERTKFHVYQIGHLHPILANFINEEEVWVPFSRLVNENNTFVNIYTSKGIHLSLADSYFAISHKGNLILAVKDHDSISANLKTEALYLRLYKNTYFGSTEANALPQGMEFAGGDMSLLVNKNNLVTRFNALSSLPGHVFYYLNGLLKDTVTVEDISSTDIAELVYDPSVKLVEQSLINELSSFTSTKDSLFKYLFHYDGSFNNVIDYHDDVDFYVSAIDSKTAVYYHRNAEDSVRQITHRDYSLPVNYIDNIINDNVEHLEPKPYMDTVYNENILEWNTSNWNGVMDVTDGILTFPPYGGYIGGTVKLLANWWIDYPNGDFDYGSLFDEDYEYTIQGTDIPAGHDLFLGVTSIEGGVRANVTNEISLHIWGNGSIYINVFGIETHVGTHNGGESYTFKRTGTILKIYVNQNVVLSHNLGLVEQHYPIAHMGDPTTETITVGYAAELVATDELVTPDPLPASLANCRIYAYVRHSGDQKPLGYEANAIHELYKLPADKIEAAMVGVDSLSVWHADTLESSEFIRLLSLPYKDITESVAEDAYGYRGITKIIGDTPSYVEDINGLNGIRLDYAYVENAIAYEYDGNGLLINIREHTDATVHEVLDPNITLVEMGGGEGSNQLDEVYGETTTTLDPNYDYRFYTCGYSDPGVPDDNYIDVTGSADYTIVDNVLTWNVDPSVRYTLVRSNKVFLQYEIDYPSTGGIFEFTLHSMQEHDGILDGHAVTVPLGELDIIINGYSLVEGIDYFVDYPRVFIVSKKYFNDIDNTDQTVVVRHMGFCKDDLTMQDTMLDSGFIVNDRLSKNARFNIRDDRVIRITIGGKVYHHSALSFSEDHPGVSGPVDTNGLPYSVRDVVVPMKGSDGDAYELRDISLARDKLINDYMTLYMPEENEIALNPITTKHPVYSLFMSRIIDLIVDGDLDEPYWVGTYTDQQVLDTCQPYEDLLPFDVTQTDVLLSDKYMEIHPHISYDVKTVSVYAYQFLNRVNKLYCYNKINLSGHVAIG